MEPENSLHVVFGATGAIGGAVVGELLREGRSVRAVSRGGRAPLSSITAQIRHTRSGHSCSPR